MPVTVDGCLLGQGQQRPVEIAADLQQGISIACYVLLPGRELLLHRRQRRLGRDQVRIAELKSTLLNGSFLKRSAMVLLWLTVVVNAASERDTGPAAAAAPPIT